MSSTNSNRNYHLDALRGLSALVVVFDHLHQDFSVPLKDAHGPIRLFYLEHYFAGAAVMLFFGLSGYLVGLSAWNSIQGGRWSWSNYLTSRFTRLYVALIPAMLLTLCLDMFGRFLVLQRIVWFDGVDRWQDFVGCLFFLQHVFVMPFGSNGPLWSLSYEFWFYILFPPFALLLLRKKNVFGNLLIAGLAICLVRWKILHLFPCWLLGTAMGVFANRWRALRKRTAVAMAIAGILLLCGVVMAEGLHVVPFDYYYADSIAIVPLLWAALKAPKAKSALYQGLAVFFSEISYTVYLTHAPFLAFLRLAWLKGRVWPADGKHLLMLAGPFTAALVLGYLLWWLFESRTDRVRNFVKSRLVSREREAVLAGR